jgi:hypothetical protein
VFPKTDEQKKRIKAVLDNSFLFMTLDDKDLQTVIGAMQEVVCTTSLFRRDNTLRGATCCLTETSVPNCADSATEAANYRAGRRWRLPLRRRERLGGLLQKN